MDAGTHEYGDANWRAQAGALRRLALGLVRDGHEADDVLQEVWLRARGDEPRTRAWLATTLRNLVRDRARMRARRAAHERVVARGEALPSAEAVLEQLEAAQELARELARLGEAHRLVLHLRYFEGLAPEEIACRLGLPRETVRTRLKRALAELRTRLDRAHAGERRAWALALVPLVRTELMAGASTALTVTGTVGGMLMGTKLVVSGAVAAVALVLFFWSRAPERDPAAAGFIADVSDAQPPASAAQASAEAAREELVTHQPTPSVPATTRASDARAVEVQVVVEDEQGRELTGESGTLTIGVVESPDKGEVLERTFEGGRLTLDVPAGRSLVFGTLVVRGRDVALPDPELILPGDEPLVVRGRWLQRGTLRVVDAASKEALADVEVRYADGWRGNPQWTHPGDHPSIQVLVAHGSSPIELPERQWTTPYWVHAPGYAWTRVDFVHAQGGERTVELATARGTVEVSSLGAVPPGAFVRLYPLAPPGSELRPRQLDFPSDTGAVSVSLAARTPTRIEDLEPGRFLAALETGEYESRLRLGTLEFELTAGETARIAIPLDGPAAAPKTHLVGTLRVPPELVGARQQLRLERLEKEQPNVFLWIGDMDESDDDETLLSWDAGEVRTGTWIANLPNQYRVKFEADVAGGESRVELVMPPLGTITLEVVEAASGAPLVPKRLNWSLAPLEGVSHGTSQPALHTGPDGSWQIVAPQGRVRIYAQEPGFQEAEETVELGTEVAHVRLALARATGVRVQLRDGSAAVPVKFDWFYKVEARDAAGQRLHDYRAVAGEIGTRILPGGGHYRLTFPDLDGFRPLAAREIDVAEGEILDLIVPLERE